MFSASMLLTLSVLRWWPGDRLIIVRMFNYAMPWFLLVLVPLLCLAGGTGRKWLLLTILVPTLYIIFSNLPLFLPKNLPQSPTGFKLKVMSYNVWSRNLDIEEATRVIKEENPDVLLLQELPKGKINQFSTLLAEVFPATEESYVYSPKAMLATFSRYPLSPEPFTAKKSVQRLLVQTPAGPLTIFNIHFLSSFREKTISEHFDRSGQRYLNNI